MSITRRSFLNQATGTALFATVGAAVFATARSCTPSADVIAKHAPGPMLDLTDFEAGKDVLVKYHNLPLNIRRLSKDDETALQNLPPPLWADSAPRIFGTTIKFTALWRICPYRNCVPLADGVGDYNGYFCPCCAGHYDLAGYFRKGIATNNLKPATVTLVTDTSFHIAKPHQTKANPYGV
ncbi:MAG: hypothetical protein ACU0A6_01415 [Shimia sp.]|uniref:hypothetical protein n=1 Tax=Shimia sp. TaxID=1954381 RepID=UPI00405950D5